MYDTEHVPNLLKVPGVIAVARFKTEELTLSIGGERKRIVIENEPRYGALYEIESPEVLVSDALGARRGGGALAGTGCASTPRTGGMYSTAASAAERSRGVVLVAAAALCWSTGGLIARLVDTDTWTTVFWRSIFAAVFLLGVTLVQERGVARAWIHRVGWGMGWPGWRWRSASPPPPPASSTLARTTVANTLVIQSTSPFHRGAPGLGVDGRARPAPELDRDGGGAGGRRGDGLALVGRGLHQRRPPRARHRHRLRHRDGDRSAGIGSSA